MQAVALLELIQLIFYFLGDEEVLDTPAVPTGLSANGAFQNIIIDWDNPTFFGFSHIEIWAATSNSFANRSFVGQTTANVFTHQVGTNQTRYYWIRHVNTQGVAYVHLIQQQEHRQAPH